MNSPVSYAQIRARSLHGSVGKQVKDVRLSRAFGLRPSGMELLVNGPSGGKVPMARLSSF